MTAIPIKTLTPAELPDWLTQQPAAVGAWVAAQKFSAASDQFCPLPAADGTLQRVLCGVGDKRNLWSLGRLPQQLAADVYALEEDWSAPATLLMALGFRLGAYRFERYLEADAEVPQLQLPAEMETAVARQCQAVSLVRDLVNTPAEDMGPAELAAAVREVAQRFDADCTETVGDDLLAENFPAIHVVGRAAAQAPRLLRLSWGNADHPVVALVGKGVCFDSGGLDIKSASGMLVMKKDMGGAAHALAVAQLVMQSQLPVRLHLLIPAVENAISGNAYRPGDVIATRKGLSVEVGNTDAEGRIVLSDALTYAAECNAELIVDFATLTGAARVALGTDLPALFANRDETADGLLECARALDDPMWQMPLYGPYSDLLKSPIADLNNISSSSFGGCITAALFLQRFVPEGADWCHIDTYAWNQADRPGRPKGGEALGARAVFEYLRRRYG